MTKDEALKLALEALEDLGMKHYESTGEVLYKDTFTAIKEALAKSEQELVAFENWHKTNYVQNLERYGDTYKNNHVRCRHQGWLGAQSFLPQRTWVGLSDVNAIELWQLVRHDIVEFARVIEAKLKEKNTSLS